MRVRARVRLTDKVVEADLLGQVLPNLRAKGLPLTGRHWRRHGNVVAPFPAALGLALPARVGPAPFVEQRGRCAVVPRKEPQRSPALALALALAVGGGAGGLVAPRGALGHAISTAGVVGHGKGTS